MTFYIRVALSKDGIVGTKGKIERTDMRAHASELIYGDAAYLQGVAQEQWPDLAWRIEHVRTSKYVVKGESKDSK